MRTVSATELAKLGKCEQQTYLDHKLGADHSLTAEYIKRGNDEHQAFSRRISGQDRRCFIASAVFGIDAPETNYLRSFRDKHLMAHAPGRVIINFYYFFSPFVVNLLETYPILVQPMQNLIRYFIKVRRS
ncbi:hypothetical protein SPFL3102_03777 [Sporomusaceae bacterium FL31]|nr:hypothetical protein SPFL3101_01506 [Sporomusaceae bacterium FL31]GCE35918.1 hypothetical protein SPFL3102_03777 [Sporomusaceae bacterium]